jgi:hypothetical protein
MHITDAVRALDRELREIFDRRLQSLVTYAPAAGNGAAQTPTLAVVDNVTAEDLRACADRVVGWHEQGLATPLLLEAREFERSLDAFPLEFGAILADHALVSGVSPFDGLRVEPADLRRACEVQARSHLLHLREGYIETEGRSDALGELILRSAGPMAALLKSIARLQGGFEDPVLTRVAHLNRAVALSSDAARQIFPAYLEAVERLTQVVDRWGER